MSTIHERPSRLDRMSFVPLYYQLQEILKEEIESGLWQPGDRLPSEPTLARRFGVSRVVVRQALAILEDDRQISRVRGNNMRAHSLCANRLETKITADKCQSKSPPSIFSKRNTPMEKPWPRRQAIISRRRALGVMRPGQTRCGMMVSA